MVIDDEILGETDEFLDDTLLREFANDQGLTFGWQIGPAGLGSLCTIELDGRRYPAAQGHSDQGALDNASVQVIQLRTRGDVAAEPELAFA